MDARGSRRVARRRPRRDDSTGSWAETSRASRRHERKQFDALWWPTWFERTATMRRSRWHGWVAGRNSNDLAGPRTRRGELSSSTRSCTYLRTGGDGRFHRIETKVARRASRSEPRYFATPAGSPCSGHASADAALEAAEPARFEHQAAALLPIPEAETRKLILIEVRSRRPPRRRDRTNIGAPPPVALVKAREM